MFQQKMQHRIVQVPVLTQAVNIVVSDIIEDVRDTGELRQG